MSFWGCPCPPLLLAPMQGGDAALTILGWMQMQLERGSTSPAPSISFVCIPCPLFSLFSFPGKLPNIFVSDCEIRVTILCT